MKRTGNKLKRLFGKKLRSKAGETLVETLVTILICVFASVMFAGAVAASSRMNQTAHTEDAEFEGDLILIETGSDCSVDDGSVHIHDASGEVSDDINVDYYGRGQFHTYDTVSDE